MEFFNKFHTWLVKASELACTRKELLQFGKNPDIFGEEIRAVLEENEFGFSSDSETWATMTNLITEFAQKEEELLQAV